MSDETAKRSWPKTLVLIPLLPFGFVIACAFMLALLLIVGTWNSAVYLVYWLRSKVTGAGIPRKP